MLAISSDDAGGKEEYMEDFSLEMSCESIGTTEQTRGVRVVNLLVPTEEEEEEEEEEKELAMSTIPSCCLFFVTFL